MITVSVPSNNTDERDYILHIIFYEFLGIKYNRIYHESKLSNSWEIVLENENRIVIEDDFFNHYFNALEYLKLENIPSKVIYTSNQFVEEDDIPILYGKEYLDISENEEGKISIQLGIDIFASCFFMLTRWEEYVNKTRDTHGRFSAFESLAFKENFLDRPIVNEYVEMLWNMLVFLGIKQTKKPREYKVLLTHDVDVPLQYPSLKNALKWAIKRRDFSPLYKKLYALCSLGKDPFDTFEYLMDISERKGVKSYFFFMGRGRTKFDNMYASDNSFILTLIEKIKKRGHNIGMHPTYSAYNDSQQFSREKKELQENFTEVIEYGRNHYLRFGIPDTWQVWDDNQMKWDSTLGYADKEGFRCGVCYEYSVFNIITKKMLRLKEKPLIVMDASFVGYQKDISSEAVEHKIKELMKKVKKYHGEFVFLWHNSSFNTKEWKKYQGIYAKVLD